MRGDGATETLHSDVVIVGAGPAGMAAAASAAEAGASVVVLESDNCIGGNAIRSNGYLAFVGDDEDQGAVAIQIGDLGFTTDGRQLRNFGSRHGEAGGGDQGEHV